MADPAQGCTQPVSELELLGSSEADDSQQLTGRDDRHRRRAVQPFSGSRITEGVFRLVSGAGDGDGVLGLPREPGQSLPR